MTTLNLCQQPSNEPDQRAAADLKQKKATHASKDLARRRHAERELQTLAVFEQGRAAWEAGRLDPHLSPGEVEQLRLGCLAAEQEHSSAKKRHLDHVQEHGDLEAQGRELARAEHDLLVEQVRAEHRAVITEFVTAMFQAAQLEQKVHRIQRTAPPDAGLVPVTFPVGIFRPMKSPEGRMLSVWRDDVLRAIAMKYPEVLRILPDQTLVAELLAEVETWRARGTGVLSIAGAPGWHITGGWHSGGTSQLDEQGLLTNRVRRELHDLV